MTKDDLRAALWSAINAYAHACGGDTSDRTVSSARMDAVVAVERALRAARATEPPGLRARLDSLARYHAEQAGYGGASWEFHARAQTTLEDVRAALASPAPPAPDEREALFASGSFTLHSGAASAWKVECDALTESDWRGLAAIAVERLPPFGAVEGVPRGGIPFADALRPHATTGPLLIAEDVCTTGTSMERHRAGREAIGVAAFARGSCPSWVTPLWSLASPRSAPAGETPTFATLRLPTDFPARVREAEARLDAEEAAAPAAPPRETADE